MKKQKFEFQIVGQIQQHTLDRFLEFTHRLGFKRKFDMLIHTEGGNGEVATSIYDYIRQHKLKATIYCLGKIESAGMVILKAGHKKISYPNTVFMVHKGFTHTGNRRIYEDSIFGGETKRKVEIFNVAVQAMMPKGIVLERKAKFFSATEAKELGFVDEVLSNDTNQLSKT